MQINRKYLFAFLVLLLTEIIIALFVHDSFIRPYLGDLLVIILIYTMVRSVTQKSIRFLPLYIFSLGVIAELVQYFRIVHILHWENNKIISTIFGTQFDIKDILLYFIAAVILMVWENQKK